MDRERIKSNLLSHILDINGLNKYASKLRERNMHMEEFTETFLSGSKYIGSGSFVEGTNIRGSNSDVMIQLNGIAVVDENEYLLNTAIELLIEKDGCNPGYIKLICRKLDFSAKYFPYDPCGQQFISNLPFLKKKCGNKTYISSEQFNNFIHLDLYTLPDKFTDPAITISGPARKSKTLLGEVDFVLAIECGSWPPCAQQWLSRSRKHQWPSKQFLKSLSDTCKCYVVPTGDESSPIVDIQWRISFVSIERELVWQMNDIQLKCFITLKTLLERTKIALPNNTLKTYHLKNAMFWLIEETPVEQWSAHLLHARVIECLEKIIQYVRNKCLPQYMLPENNLFRNRFMTKAVTKDTITCLKNMHGNVLKIVKDGYGPCRDKMDKKVYSIYPTTI
jgi:hypothetical protein